MIRESARAAWRCLALERRGDGWTLGPLPSSLTEQERDQVALGCYEMLMVLAEATAQPRPANPPSDRRAQAIGILDRATLLRSQPTHAYRMRRASFLERAGDISGEMRERAAAQRIQPEGAFDHFLSGLEQYEPRAARASQAAFPDGLAGPA